MRKKPLIVGFVSGVYRTAEDASLHHSPRIHEVRDRVRTFVEEKRQRKLRAKRGRPGPKLSQAYDTPTTPELQRATYRMIGEKHPSEEES